MDRNKALEGHKHLLQHFDTLSPTAQNALLTLLSSFDPTLYQKQLQAFQRKHVHLQPLTDCKQSSLIHDTEQARDEFDRGRVGCLLLAGGEGSRMQSSLPKALTKLPLIEQKTLLQLFCEKINAHPMPLAIMTSQTTHKLIADYLEEHNNFDLEPELFMQPSLPFLDDDKEWFLQSSGDLAQGPNGNGEALHHFYRSGIWKKWSERGVREILIIPIDNPLADPFDPLFVQSHLDNSATISLKAVLPRDANECVGRIGTLDGKANIIEYSEVYDEEKSQLNLANTGCFCIDLDFAAQVATDSSLDLPLHIAQKQIISDGKEKNIYKSETFLFDLLPYSSKTNVILFPRETTFAPIKDQKSLAFAQRALYQK